MFLIFQQEPSRLWSDQSNIMQHNMIEFIQDVLISIHENIRELKERKNFADPEELTHIEAKLLAYHEVLGIIKFSADEFKIPTKEIGIG